MDFRLDSSEFKFDPRANRYRWKDSGRFVNSSQFKSLTRKLIKGNESKITDLANQYYDRTINYNIWRTETLKTLKQLSIQSYVLQRGGAGRLSSGDLDGVQSHLKRQFGYFRDLSNKIYQGRISEKEALRRLRLYTKNATTVQTIADTQNLAEEYTVGYRVLGDAEHCPDCIRYASLGIMASKNLIAPGVDCICGYHCHCTLVLFKDPLKAKEAKEKGLKKPDGSALISYGLLSKQK